RAAYGAGRGSDEAGALRPGVSRGAAELRGRVAAQPRGRFDLGPRRFSSPRCATRSGDPMRPFRTLVLCAFVIIVPASVRAQQTAGLTARVDETFARWSRGDSPGCAVGVMRDGATVLERAYGMAD